MRRLCLAIAAFLLAYGVSGETAFAQRAMSRPLPRPVAAKPQPAAAHTPK